LLKDFNILKKP